MYNVTAYGTDRKTRRRSETGGVTADAVSTYRGDKRPKVKRRGIRRSRSSQNLRRLGTAALLRLYAPGGDLLSIRENNSRPRSSACERTGFRQTPIQKRGIIKKLIAGRA